jgi:hypothetical protein
MCIHFNPYMLEWNEIELSLILLQHTWIEMNTGHPNKTWVNVPQTSFTSHPSWLDVHPVPINISFSHPEASYISIAYGVYIQMTKHLYMRPCGYCTPWSREKQPNTNTCVHPFLSQTQTHVCTLAPSFGYSVELASAIVVQICVWHNSTSSYGVRRSRIQWNKIYWP